MSNNRVIINQSIKKFININENLLFDKKNVIGIGIGHKIIKGINIGEKCITIFVTNKIKKSLLREEDLIPEKINMFKTDVVEVGNILSKGVYNYCQSPLTERIRPAVGGCSIGNHLLLGSGTLGACVYDDNSSTSECYILSNNHVLANYNDAYSESLIVQPGIGDGGIVSSDAIASLSRFIPIEFSTCGHYPINYVDAAIAVSNRRLLGNYIYGIGCVHGVNNNPQIGNIVQKTGRTTGVTMGAIMATNATINIMYPNGLSARFTEQIVTTKMAEDGDSGSLLCDLNGHAVGLIFASSPNVTFANRISLVLKKLKIKLSP